jgi:CheY-like chemotaxis protein
VSVQKLIDESISLVLRGSNVKGIVDIAESIQTIEADEGQITQVFHNIILNATQAMPGGGTLTVKTQNVTLPNKNSLLLPPGEYVKVAFSDEGCGIPSESLKKIFDPYFTTKSAGTGLGLASVHSIVLRHGGTIDVSSTVGQGTTFTIYLPSTGIAAVNQKDSAAIQAVNIHSGGSILVMDDEEIIQDLSSEMLKHLGYDVAICSTGTEAIALYQEAMRSGTPYSAVIMDLTIPGGMGGKETATRILEIDPAACLIVSSGYSNDPIMADYSNFGFSGAVSKPYNMAEFSQLISSLLKRH